MTRNFAANLKIGAAMGSSVGRVFGGLKTRIKEQEATLKGLRAAYKDAAKGTGEYAGKLDLLKSKTEAAERELKKLRAASRFDIGGAMGNVGSAFRGDLARAGVVGGALSAAGIGIANNMLQVTATFEKALTVLKTIEGDAAKAENSFKWVQEFAARTPYELQQVLDGFVKLKAYGLDPIADDTLRILGDTSAAMGKDLMDAIEAMADAVTGENERLKEFGIKASKENGKILYRYTDRSGKELTKLVDANNRKMIQSTLLAIFNEKYKGAMDDQSRTWNGMVSNLQDTWARFAFDVMSSGPFEELKGQLKSYLDQLEIWAKDGTMKRWAEQTGRWMVDTGRKIGDVATKIYRALDAVQSFLGGWDKLGYALIALNFAPTIVAIGQMVKGLWGMSAASAALGLKFFILAAAIGAITWAIADWEGFEETVSSALEGAFGEENMLKVGQFFTKLQDDFAAFPDNVASLFVGVTQLLVWKVKEVLYKLRTEVMLAVNDMKEAFASLFTWLTAKFDAVGRKITEMWNSVKGLGQGVMEFFGVGPGPAPLAPAAPLVKPENMSGPDRSTSSNTYQINVTTPPGADGARIADEIRSSFQRKPLFDSDGALLPA
jgi:hypothetical protein